MLRWLINLDRTLHRQLLPISLLFLFVVLRLPNFCEPYWYGDEGIYLTIGQSLRQGARMYADIVDHKTPLIYYFAMVPNQFWFRVVFVSWMAVTTLLFYGVVSRLIKQPWLRGLTTLLFIALTSLPSFEGNIPNGELFMMGFVMLGAWLALRYPLWQGITKPPTAATSPPILSHPWYLLAIGASLGLGILVKVPALFDAVAVASLAWWAGWHHYPQWPQLTGKSLRQWWQHWWPFMGSAIMVLLGVILMVAASMIYYWSKGTFAAYLQFGLLYNFHYSSNWQLNLTPALSWLFTMPGKFSWLVAGWLVLTALHRRTPATWNWAAGWLLLSLFASLLSNRPYPHYFLQTFPPLVLVIGLSIQSMVGWRPTKKDYTALAVALLGCALLLFEVTLLRLIGTGRYPTRSYYGTFWQLATGQISRQQYQESFNYIISDNTRAAAIITAADEKRLFIWGTNPMLYALTKTRPIGRFTVAFHIKDLQVEDETYQVVTAEQPRFIVVMNDEARSFPALNSYLNQFYIANTDFSNFTLWKRL